MDAHTMQLLMESDTMRNIVFRCFIGEISPPIAVMQLLIQMKDVEKTTDVIQHLCESHQRFIQMRQLLLDNSEGCARVVTMLHSGLDAIPQVSLTDQRIAFFGQIFDQAVTQSPDASVALYSLGNSRILHKATKEIVDLFDDWGMLGKDKNVLQIGCGTGRLEEALAGHVQCAYGIDVSANMIEVARSRCKEFGNVCLSTCSGKDLSLFSSHMFDLVYAVDSFPYIYEAGGMSLVNAHFTEVVRVLKNKGAFVILNYSYRDDIAADQADIIKLANDYGLEVLANGIRPFTLWDGAVWWLQYTG
jgi:ubiquinone/menaquinone biosynthesis C-methylase UbiE